MHDCASIPLIVLLRELLVSTRYFSHCASLHRPFIQLTDFYTSFTHFLLLRGVIAH